MQGALARAIPQTRQALAQSRQMSSVIASPPLTRISFAEKVVHGVIIAGGCLAIPAWVLVNIKNYRGKAE